MTDQHRHQLDLQSASGVFTAVPTTRRQRVRVADASRRGRTAVRRHGILLSANREKICPSLGSSRCPLTPRAIEIAQRKGADRGVTARFLVWDALALRDLGQQFDTVIDSYVSSLADAVGTGGRVLLACFSDRQPGVWGPRRVREAELRDAFADGWIVESIEPTRFQTNLGPGWAEAWLARIRRDTR